MIIETYLPVVERPFESMTALEQTFEQLVQKMRRNRYKKDDNMTEINVNSIFGVFMSCFLVHMEKNAHPPEKKDGLHILNYLIN